MIEAHMTAVLADVGYLVFNNRPELQEMAHTLLQLLPPGDKMDTTTAPFKQLFNSVNGDRVQARMADIGEDTKEYVSAKEYIAKIIGPFINKTLLGSSDRAVHNPALLVSTRTDTAMAQGPHRDWLTKM
jgi:hypothetical protein